MKLYNLFSLFVIGGLSLCLAGCLTSQPVATPPPATGERAAATGLVTLGEVEPLQIVGKGDPVLAARIDSGAQTSSLGATDIAFMERDGKRWVRFRLQDRQKTPMERPVARMLRIKRHGEKAQKRPVVLLDIRLGGKTMKREFSLTDRSKFTYPALIGRNVLQGRFLIDVSKKNITSPLSEENRK